MTDNWMELGLTKEEDEFVRRNADSYKKLYVETIDTIFGWAKAIEILRKAHANSGVRGAFTDALIQYGFTDRTGVRPMNKALLSHLTELLKNEAKVRAWWDKVPENKKRFWLSTKAIYVNWKASLRPPVDPDATKRTDHAGYQQRFTATASTATDRGKSDKAEASVEASAERHKREHAEAEVARLKAENATLVAENAALVVELKARDSGRTAAPTQSKPTREELAKYAVRVPEKLPTLEEVAAMKAAAKAAAARPEAIIAVLESKLQKAQARIAKLESDNALQEEIAARDKRIMALTTETRNLKRKEHHHRQFYEEELKRKGTMPFTTYAKVVQCLHPERDPPTPEQRKEAFAMFSQWKQANDRAPRT
jgi:hypothetical protein